jgi:hypothetical protein
MAHQAAEIAIAAHYHGLPVGVKVDHGLQH